MAKSRNRKVENFVKQAAFIKREFQGLDETERFVSCQEGRVLYVYDTDIIVTKCAPWITGPVGEKGDNGYGSLFIEEGSSDESRESAVPATTKAEIIASILASHVLDLQRKGNDAPIFQFPSHARETNNVYRAVRRTIETFDRLDFRGRESRRTFELSRAMALLRHRAKEGATQHDVTVTIDKVVHWLMYSDHSNSKRARALREWDAYYALEAEFGGIYSLEKATAFFPRDAKLVDALQALQPSGRTRAEERLFENLVAHWTEVLARRGRKNIEADAQALACLFLVGWRLSETRWRCVFVTGDRALVRAAYASIPDAILPEEVSSYASEFSFRNIRHLWAYSSDALIEPGKEDHLADLFNGLLGYWSDQLRFSRRELERLLVRNELGSAGISVDGLSRAMSEWDQLTSKAIASHSFKEFEKEDELRAAIWKVVKRSTAEDSWEKLEQDLHEQVARVRDRTILSMSDLGIDFIIEAKNLGKRNPPELIFESLTNTNKIFEKLCTFGGYDTAASFELDFQNIALDCHDSASDDDDRQQSYLKFLVLGAAFASAEKWFIAFSHAERAIEIIRRSESSGPIPVKHDESRLDGPRSHMSGREAYFLAAVARRTLAAKLADFEEADASLKEAVDALHQDWRKKTALHITPARFDNERLAIALGRYYLSRSNDPISDFGELAKAIYVAAGKAVELFVDWRSGRDSRSLRKITVVNLATNIIQTFIIGEYRAYNGLEPIGSSAISRDVIEDAVDTIVQLTNYKSTQNDSIIATRLIRSYALAAEIFLVKPSAAALELIRVFRRRFEKEVDAVVTVYDPWRYQWLLHFLEARFRA